MQMNFIPSDDKINITVRTTGDWFSKAGDLSEAHYYICKNPSANVAISLCGSRIVAIKKLQAPLPGKRCLVCGLFADGRKAGNKANDKVLASLLNSKTDKPSE